MPADLITIAETFSDLNPKGRGTALIEILILMLVAFLLGWLSHWAYGRYKGRDTGVDDYEDEEFDNYVSEPHQTVKPSSDERPISDVNPNGGIAVGPVSNIHAATTPRAGAVVSRVRGVSRLPGSRKKAPDDEPVDHTPSPAPEPKKPASSRHVMPAPEPAPEADVDEMAAEIGANEKPDDLTMIEGIGPRIASLLNDADITNFAELGQSTESRLQSILDEAGPRYRMHDPSSWPQQAKLAAGGKFDELNKLQDSLDGGRR